MNVLVEQDNVFSTVLFGKKRKSGLKKQISDISPFVPAPTKKKKKNQKAPRPNPGIGTEYLRSETFENCRSLSFLSSQPDSTNSS